MTKLIGDGIIYGRKKEIKEVREVLLVLKNYPVMPVFFILFLAALCRCVYLMGKMIHAVYRRKLIRQCGACLLVCFLSGAVIGIFVWMHYIPVNTNSTFVYEDLPSYNDAPVVEVNDNIPFFTSEELEREEYEAYSPLDLMGRCGPAEAMIGEDMLGVEERGEIGMIKPSGWQTVRYDDLVDGKYLYNRCHLIAYELTGENANERNLITGTRYMNVEGMQPYENMTAWYIARTGNHVMYRSTPVFAGSELVARGVLLEARSVEDGGEGICFCVFCYNIQPGIEIDYTNGESSLKSHE